MKSPPSRPGRSARRTRSPGMSSQTSWTRRSVTLPSSSPATPRSARASLSCASVAVVGAHSGSATSRNGRRGWECSPWTRDVVSSSRLSSFPAAPSRAALGLMLYLVSFRTDSPPDRAETPDPSRAAGPAGRRLTPPDLDGRRRRTPQDLGWILAGAGTGPSGPAVLGGPCLRGLGGLAFVLRGRSKTRPCSYRCRYRSHSLSTYASIRTATACAPRSHSS